MKRVLAIIVVVSVMAVGGSSEVEEERVSDQALKNAQSKFETSASKEASGGASYQSAAEVGER